MEMVKHANNTILIRESNYLICDSSEEASEVTTFQSTIDISKIDCDKVVYSADWEPDETLEVIRHCTGADTEVR